MGCPALKLTEQPYLSAAISLPAAYCDVEHCSVHCSNVSRYDVEHASLLCSSPYLTTLGYSFSGTRQVNNHT